MQSTPQQRMGARPLATLPPIYVVLGCTGVGKTKLGVELARKVGGEVINVDAMQLYEGLPIATNQVTEEERQGVPHHLIAVLDPLRTKRYDARSFRNDALPLLHSLRASGTPPVLVGGTMYYLEALLWDFLMLDEDHSRKEEDALVEADEYAKLNNAELYEVLSEKDPAAALKFHPNDRRKVYNAIRFINSSGALYSQRVIDQLGKEGVVSGERRFPPGQVVAFYLHSSPQQLHPRLDRRVDAMMEAGLLEELQTFYARCREVEIGKRGIWQCIGFKEFLPFLQLSEEEQESEEGQKLRQECIQQLKLSTRQYSRRQLKWISNRFLVRPRSHAVAAFQLDSSQPELWPRNVSAPLDRVLDFHRRRSSEEAPPGRFPDDQSFFQGCPVAPIPPKVPPSHTPAQNRCSVCGGQLFVTQEQWEQHLKSKKHYNRQRMQRKQAEELEECKEKRKRREEESDEPIGR